MGMQIEIRANARRRGFSIIEIMIAMAIIGVLATVAIPKYAVYQLKTKSAEAKTNLGGIRTSQEAYYGEYGVFVAANPEPALIPGANRAGFDAVGSDFQALGWQPEGNVFFSYGVAINADGTAYTADAGADIDADGVAQFWAYAKPEGGGALVPAAVGCNVGAITGNDVEPCDPAAGQSVF